MKHKTFLLIGFMLFCGLQLYAQVAINTNGSSADGSAMLDVKSTDKGVLLPRLTTVQIATLENPIDGLIVYNTNESRFYFFDEGSSLWREIAIGAGSISPTGSFSCGDDITDIRDSKTYKTVQIGSQCWMGENLAATELTDGTAIPNITVGGQWSGMNSMAYCWFNNDYLNYGSIYGAMYNWYTAQTGKICPDGWHVPSDMEWDVLIDYVIDDGWSGNDATALKATTSWSNEGNGVDEYGFTAFQAGGRNSNSDFDDYYAFWWSSTSSSSIYAYGRRMYYGFTEVSRDQF